MHLKIKLSVCKWPFDCTCLMTFVENFSWTFSYINSKHKKNDIIQLSFDEKKVLVYLAIYRSLLNELFGKDQILPIRRGESYSSRAASMETLLLCKISVTFLYNFIRSLKWFWSVSIEKSSFRSANLE